MKIIIIIIIIIIIFATVDVFLNYYCTFATKSLIRPSLHYILHNVSRYLNNITHAHTMYIVVVVRVVCVLYIKK